MLMIGHLEETDVKEFNKCKKVGQYISIIN
jgi:hypothetical protein